MCACCGGFGGPPYGIPIEEETHNKYSQKVKDAWVLFDKWFAEQRKIAEARFEAAISNSEHGEGGNLTIKDIEEAEKLRLVDRKVMPPEVKAAMDLILETPIPGYEDEGFTGSDSCYMVTALSLMTEKEE